MGAPVFYHTNLSVDEIILDENESKHSIKVLRLNVGDKIILADGKGNIATALITDNHPKRCKLNIIERLFVSPQDKGRTYNLHLLIAPTKNAERMEWFLEKAVECGIDEITFIETERGERTKVNMDRLEKIAISAMKQSKQWYIPKINLPIPFNIAIKKVEGEVKLLAWCEEEKGVLLRSQLANQPKSIVICIGPEGDFTLQEMKDALELGFAPITLGNTILRTETAALFGVMACKAILA
ncbi:MAG: 16S rRNA (uracil(1498)-N(3))-methyltransferase [Bacteroidia bacterium]|jgi:16S rRNA (uracil1498-N3)-methyltransferase|nr:16S rRNA (uracil(1498)-N(3))-methyltransferase [Bacteroidia bacterium]